MTSCHSALASSSAYVAAPQAPETGARPVEQPDVFEPPTRRLSTSGALAVGGLTAVLAATSAHKALHASPEACAASALWGTASALCLVGTVAAADARWPQPPLRAAGRWLVRNGHLVAAACFLGSAVLNAGYAVRGHACGHHPTDAIMTAACFLAAAAVQGAAYRARRSA